MAKRMGRTGHDEHRLPKWADKLRRSSEGNGWTWRTTGSGHVSVFRPDGTWVCSISQSAYDGALTRKLRSRLRRAGCPGA